MTIDGVKTGKLRDRGTRTLRKPAAALLAVASAASLSVTALSSPSSAATRGRAETAASHRAKPINITIGIGALAGIQVLPYYVQDAHIFQKYGLNVTLDVLSATTVLPALASDKVQFASMASPQPETGAIEALPIKWVAAWADQTSFQMCAGPSITSMKDLVGKPIGVTAPGSTTEILTELALRKAGISPSSVNFVPLGSVSGEISGFASGEVSAFLCEAPTNDEAFAKLPGAHSIDTLGDTVPWVDGGLAGNWQWVTKHSTATVKLIEAISAGVKSWLTHPAQVEATLSKITGDTQSVASEAYKPLSSELTTNLVPRTSVEASVLHGLVVTGANPLAARAKPTSFLSFSYAEKAMAALK